ncbi:polysaccharide deacetylase family protein [Paenibacillus sp. LHD-38]|uniref:polysaccharide deacetylase family protein n=1 Tax=Paenibacillus sp. LHD-38 TaxID=3072143 RepID=UPI00280E3E71|nr:polysaccharide deacetylase family protein [Paenibacillus sp. LHD-38]MDQ8738067.1 polysaccharide deacetylase family protein [Paenibacillus sp. LHD-38]
MDISPYDGLKPEDNNPNGIYYKNRVLVLMYHDLSPEPKDAGTLSVANFEKQLELMRDNNFHWISMKQYTDFILHSAPVPDNAVLLTFDDGYESFYTYAYPLIKKYQAPVSNFLIVNAIDNPEYKGIPKVTWEQVELMHRNGIEFFSHTYDSHKYAKTDSTSTEETAMLAGRIYLKDMQRKETEEEYKLRVTNDLKQANDILEQKLGIQNNVLAFPFGGFSESLLDICDQLGIDVTLTVKMGLNKPGQTNGFRLNTGGMANDPALQLSLMKHAEKKLGNIQFDEGIIKRHYFTIKALLVLMVVFALWLWSGWRLLAKRKRKMSLHGVKVWLD